jgi:hypothetical protein
MDKRLLDVVATKLPRRRIDTLPNHHNATSPIRQMSLHRFQFVQTEPRVSYRVSRKNMAALCFCRAPPHPTKIFVTRGVTRSLYLVVRERANQS